MESVSPAESNKPIRESFQRDKQVLHTIYYFFEKFCREKMDELVEALEYDDSEDICHAIKYEVDFGYDILFTITKEKFREEDAIVLTAALEGEFDEMNILNGLEEQLLECADDEDQYASVLETFKMYGAGKVAMRCIFKGDDLDNIFDQPAAVDVIMTADEDDETLFSFRVDQNTNPDEAVIKVKERAAQLLEGIIYIVEKMQFQQILRIAFNTDEQIRAASRLEQETKPI